MNLKAKKVGSSIQSGIRPVLVVSNNMNNAHSPTVNVLPLTSKVKRTDLPVHVVVRGYGLPRTSMVLAEHMITLDKEELNKENYLGFIDDKEIMNRIVNAINVQVGDIY